MQPDGATKNGKEDKRASLMNPFSNADRYGFKCARMATAAVITALTTREATA